MIQHTERLDLDLSSQNSVSNGESVAESGSISGPLDGEGKPGVENNCCILIFQLLEQIESIYYIFMKQNKLSE